MRASAAVSGWPPRSHSRSWSRFLSRPLSERRGTNLALIYSLGRKKMPLATYFSQTAMLLSAEIDLIAFILRNESSTA